MNTPTIDSLISPLDMRRRRDFQAVLDAEVMPVRTERDAARADLFEARAERDALRARLSDTESEAAYLRAELAERALRDTETAETDDVEPDDPAQADERAHVEERALLAESLPETVGRIQPRPSYDRIRALRAVAVSRVFGFPVRAERVDSWITAGLLGTDPTGAFSAGAVEAFAATLTADERDRVRLTERTAIAKAEGRLSGPAPVVAALTSALDSGDLTGAAGLLALAEGPRRRAV